MTKQLKDTVIGDKIEEINDSKSAIIIQDLRETIREDIKDTNITLDELFTGICECLDKVRFEKGLNKVFTNLHNKCIWREESLYYEIFNLFQELYGESLESECLYEPVKIERTDTGWIVRR